jgi:methyl-accepting chemotaxis protein
MNPNITYLLDNMNDVIIALAAIIFIGSLGLWLAWSIKIRSIKHIITNISFTLDESTLTPKEVLGLVQEECRSPIIESLLQETEEGLIELDDDFGQKAYSLRPYNEIWNIRTALSEGVNVPLFESMPNLLIGFGLMCTFIFLSIAIYSATAGLGSGEGDPQKALENLLSSAAGKFVTSIAGLFCSLLWNWAAKSLLQEVDRSIGRLISRLKKLAPDNAPEIALANQLSIFKEMLNQEREQVGQFKRFETDFAVAIAKATGEALKPAFEGLAQELKQLSDRMSSINEDALAQMLEKFGNNLQQATASEMELLKNTLTALANSLNDSGTKISEGFQEAGEKTVREIERAGLAIAESFGKGSENLKEATSALEKAILTTKGTINDFEEVVTSSVEAGSAGAQKIQELSTSLGTIVDKLIPTVANVGQLVQSIEGSVGNIQSATKGLEDTVDAQAELIRSLKSFIPDFKSSLTAAFEEMKNTAGSIDRSLTLACEKIGNASSTVDSLNSGVTAYTDRITDLHRSLDREMENAINKLGGAINNLEEALDEFSETINEQR